MKMKFKIEALKDKNGTVIQYAEHWILDAM